MTTLSAILDLKGKEVFATTPDTTVREAVDEMCRHKVGALLVKEGEAPIGIVSERDVLSRVVLEGRDARLTTVRDVMTPEVVCVNLTASPAEAMSIMTARRCRHLPVVVERRIVGMLSIGDLVRWASHNQSYEIQMLHEYLSGKYPG
ncbi:MAG: CBS domain-containing protein [Myxococcales bacterium]|jgi:IMP dehydrogenase